MVNTQGRESGGSGCETYSGAWYPRRRPCGVAINTLVDLNKLAGESPSFKLVRLSESNLFRDAGPGPARPYGRVVRRARETQGLHSAPSQQGWLESHGIAAQRPTPPSDPGLRLARARVSTPGSAAVSGSVARALAASVAARAGPAGGCKTQPRSTAPPARRTIVAAVPRTVRLRRDVPSRPHCHGGPELPAPGCCRPAAARAAGRLPRAGDSSLAKDGPPPPRSRAAAPRDSLGLSGCVPWRQIANFVRSIRSTWHRKVLRSLDMNVSQNCSGRCVADPCEPGCQGSGQERTARRPSQRLVTWWAYMWPSPLTSTPLLRPAAAARGEQSASPSPRGSAHSPALSPSHKAGRAPPAPGEFPCPSLPRAVTLRLIAAMAAANGVTWGSCLPRQSRHVSKARSARRPQDLSSAPNSGVLQKLFSRRCGTPPTLSLLLLPPSAKRFPTRRRSANASRRQGEGGLPQELALSRR